MRTPLNYNGPGLPPGYAVNGYNPRAGGSLPAYLISPYFSLHAPTDPMPYGGKRAHAELTVLDASVANYDGFTLTLRAPLEDGSTFSRVFTFDDDTAPPSTSSTINLNGLTTIAQILAQIVVAINANVTGDGVPYWIVQTVATDTILIEQNVPGYLGNLAIDVQSDLGGQLSINGVTDFAASQPKFYGGQDVVIPARVGPRFALLLGPEDNVQSTVVA